MPADYSLDIEPFAQKIYPYGIVISSEEKRILVLSLLIGVLIYSKSRFASRIERASVFENWKMDESATYKSILESAAINFTLGESAEIILSYVYVLAAYLSSF